MHNPLFDQDEEQYKADFRKFQEFWEGLGRNIYGWEVRTCDFCHKPNQPCFSDIVTFKAKCKTCIAVEKFLAWRREHTDLTLVKNKGIIR